MALFRLLSAASGFVADEAARPHGAGASFALAHVENLTSPGMSGVLRWWCEQQGHAGEPLCVRHEISLQISLAHGTERWQLQQRRNRILSEGAGKDQLEAAVSAYCAGDDGSAGGLRANTTFCRRAREGAGAGDEGEGRATLAEQLVVMNEWWCQNLARNQSLSCERHRLQQRHRAATEAGARESVRRQLEQLLARSTPESLASMREDARLMQQRYCALPGSRALELCDDSAQGGRRPGGGGGGGAPPRPRVRPR